MRFEKEEEEKTPACYLDIRLIFHWLNAVRTLRPEAIDSYELEWTAKVGS